MIGCGRQSIDATAGIFEPGKFIAWPPSISDIVSGVSRAPRTQPTDLPVRVSVPLRLYSYVHDLQGTRVRPMQTYAVAQAVEHSRATNVTVQLKEGDSLESDQRLHGAFKHFYQLFCRLLGRPIGLRVVVNSLQERHVGLGSSSAELLAFCIGLNRVLGNPFDWNDIRLLLCWNFVERDINRPDLVVPAATVGCAFVAGMYGGLTLLGPSYTLVAACAIPKEFCIVAYVPRASLRSQKSGPAPTPYFQPFPQAISECEASNLAQRGEVFFQEAIPAIQGGLFDQYVAAMAKLLQTRHHAFAARYGEGYVQHLLDLQTHGALIPGQSSSGPAAFFYAHCDDVQRLVDRLWHRRYIDATPVIGPASRGLSIFVNEAQEPVDTKIKESQVCW